MSTSENERNAEKQNELGLVECSIIIMQIFPISFYNIQTILWSSFISTDTFLQVKCMNKQLNQDYNLDDIYFYHNIGQLVTKIICLSDSQPQTQYWVPTKYPNSSTEIVH